MIVRLFENVCEDQAIEDTIYALDDTLQKGKIDVDSYTKHIRSLSRKQFYARALANKIHAKQTETQTQNMNGNAINPMRPPTNTHNIPSFNVFQSNPPHPSVSTMSQSSMSQMSQPAPQMFANYMR